MKKKIGMLMGGYLLLYYFLKIAYRLPSLIHDHNLESFYNGRLRGVIPRVIDIAIGFGFIILPYLILHLYYPAKNFLKCSVLIFLSICVVYYYDFSYSNAFVEPIRLSDHFNSHLFFYGVYILYGFIFYFIQYAHYKELEQKELLVQNKQSELSFLRSQINPHFLFNNLNNIYSLVYHKSDQALPAISGLSSLLRYMLYDTDQEIALEKEIRYLEKYIDLQKLRFEEVLNINLSIEGNTNNISIPPLLLIPFVENAFKHGDLSDKNFGIDIKLIVNQTKISFYCKNKIGKGVKDSTGGIGLINIKRRLDLLYPGKYELDISQNDNFYNIKLDLKIG